MNSVIEWRGRAKHLNPINRKIKSSQFRAIEYSTTLIIFCLFFATFVSLMIVSQTIPNHVVIIKVITILDIDFFVNTINIFLYTVIRIINSREHDLKKFLICYDNSGVAQKCFQSEYLRQHEDIVAIEQDYRNYEITDLYRELKYLNSLKVKSSISFYNKYFFASLGV